MGVTIPRLLTAYVALICVFYVQTEGFSKHHDWTYCVLKTLPCLFLALAVHLEYTCLTGTAARNHALGLLFGAIGDFLIALHDDGLFSGAFSFGLGHLMYMAHFAPQVKQVSREFAVLILMYGAMVNHFFLMPQLAVAPFSTLILVMYSLILCTALVLSGSIYFHGPHDNTPKQTNDMLRFAGYALFFLSDSLLLLCHVGTCFPYMNVAILSTYFTAQYMILTGATNQLV